MMKRYLIPGIFCFFAVTAFGQTRKIDSLKRLIYSVAGNQHKLQTIITLADEFETLPKDTLWDYAIKAKALALELNDARDYSLAVIAQAQAYLRWDNPDSAKALIEPELLKYKLEDNTNRDVFFKLEQVRIDCIGDDYNYKDATAQVYNIMRQAEKYRDSLVIAESMNTLAAWAYDMDFVTESRNLDYKALTYTTQNNPKYYAILSGIYVNLAENYNWVKMTDSGAYFANKAIVLNEKTQNLYFLSKAMQKLAGNYIMEKAYGKATKTIFKSLEITHKIEGNEPQQDKLMILASVYENSGQIDSAIKVLNDGLLADSTYIYHSPHSKKGADSKDLQLIFYYDELAKCYHLKGDSKNYEQTLEKIIAGKDAFYKANSAAALAELETKYQVQRKEATIAEQKLSLTRENYLFYGSLLFSLLGLIIVWLVFKEIRRKQKLKMQQLQEQEKALALKAVADAEESERKRIAADLHDNLGAQLSSIRRNVNFIMDQPEGFSAEDERKYLGYVNDTAQNAMIDLRETIWVLNKDEVEIQEFGDKLKSYLRQQLLGREMISWDFHEELGETWKLSSGEVMHLFRIVQELVSNIIKHSGASQINIELNSVRPNTYQLEITDNGKGFNVNNKYEGHYGLENIQQRATDINAQLTIESNYETGTRVLLNKVQNSPYVLFTGAVTSDTFIL
jgi:two-component system NarL family sensor kinase